MCKNSTSWFYRVLAYVPDCFLARGTFFFLTLRHKTETLSSTLKPETIVFTVCFFSFLLLVSELLVGECCSFCRDPGKPLPAVPSLYAKLS